MSKYSRIIEKKLQAVISEEISALENTSADYGTVVLQFMTIYARENEILDAINAETTVNNANMDLLAQDLKSLIEEWKDAPMTPAKMTFMELVSRAICVGFAMVPITSVFMAVNSVNVFQSISVIFGASAFAAGASMFVKP